MADFGGSYCALLRTERLFDLGKRTIAQNDRNTIPWTVEKIISKIWSQKIQKIDFLVLGKTKSVMEIAIFLKNGGHRSKKWLIQKIWSSFFLIGIDSEWSKI